MKMSHTFAALICATLSLASASALAAMSNEEFVQQEIKFEKQLQADAKFKTETSEFCKRLGTARQEEEPKCVALKNANINSVYGNLNSSRLRN
ncbi:hypothetical protein [Noviherbaspirillum soli]|uniref:hypothetical protein n=1 Tax=Noviherbaspirillum soli TaxID=1064518 RepID=UPI00188D960F|nr:hypothetical protein [Noviherbaspirillum soli]